MADRRGGPEVTTPRSRQTSRVLARTADTGSVQRGARLPWTCDPALRWEAGQAGAVLAAVGILRELLTTDLDPGYWRLRVGDALEALGAAVTE
jgi:hypothetical protein